MATVTAAEGTLNLQKLFRMFANKRKFGHAEYGITAPIVFTVSVPVSVLEGTDKLRLANVPSGFFADEIAIRWADEGDADGSPALVIDLLTESDAGVEDTQKLIGGSTAGQVAGGGDRLDDSAVGAHIGGKWLVLKTTTPAATAPGAAVNLRLYMRLSFGVVIEGVSKVPYFKAV